MKSKHDLANITISILRSSQH